MFDASRVLDECPRAFEHVFVRACVCARYRACMSVYACSRAGETVAAWSTGRSNSRSLRESVYGCSRAGETVAVVIAHIRCNSNVVLCAAYVRGELCGLSSAYARGSSSIVLCSASQTPTMSEQQSSLAQQVQAACAKDPTVAKRILEVAKNAHAGVYKRCVSMDDRLSMSLEDEVCCCICYSCSLPITVVFTEDAVAPTSSSIPASEIKAEVKEEEQPYKRIKQEVINFGWPCIVTG